MSKRTRLVIPILLAAVGVLGSCAKPSHELRMMVQDCEARDQVVLVKEKSPALAGALGLLFGAGSFYTRQYELGLLGVLTWPLSMLWDPFVGYLGAQRINAEATLAACRQVRWEKRAAASSPTAEEPAPTP